MKQEVHISNINKHQHIQLKDYLIAEFTRETISDGVVTQTAKDVVVYKSGANEIEDRNAQFRKLADDTVEIFVNGTSIGFGALNGSHAMTPTQLEHSAATPEADADVDHTGPVEGHITETSISADGVHATVDGVEVGAESLKPTKKK